MEKVIERTELLPVRPFPKLAEVYKDKVFFITGFTGFLAQSLVEKLLWAFPDIKCFYILIRGKRKMSPEQRLQQILDDDCFSRLRDRGDSFRHKFIPVNGDMVQPNLGISQLDREKICQEVNMVIHSAATVNFNDYMTTCIDINVIGTKSILDLASRMTCLDVFVYLSTAYTNSFKTTEVTEEKMYDPIFDWNTSIEIRKKIQPATVNILTEKLLDKMPNTYTFSKNLAEHMVYKYADSLPVVIIRPSIVSQSMHEPIPGWCININGPSGISLAYSTGVLRVNMANLDNRNDFIPCDAVNDVTIFATALRPYQRAKAKVIYHVTSNHLSVSNQEFVDMGTASVRKFPSKYCVWNPNITNCGDNFTKYYVMFMLYQIIPSLFLDLLLVLSRQKVRLYKIHQRAYNMVLGYRYFMNHDFNFDNSNTYFLSKLLSDEDRAKIHIAYEKKDVDYVKLFDEGVRYTRNRFLNQKPEDEDNARRLQRILLVIDYIFKYGILASIGWYMYSNRIIPALISTTIQFITKIN